MRTPSGHTLSQDVRVGDLLLSRDEWNPGGLVVAQRVEEVFVRDALVLELKVLGRTIRTTAEHPFHTYFVGCDEWGFSVWAHNADYSGSMRSDKLGGRHIAVERFRRMW